MTIEEAIKHCEEKASGCSECAKEHAQLAGWLKELVELRKNHAKYEAAIYMLSKCIVDCEDCDTCPATKKCEGLFPEDCIALIMSCVKRKVGLEAD